MACYGVIAIKPTTFLGMSEQSQTGTYWPILKATLRPFCLATWAFVFNIAGLTTAAETIGKTAR